MISTSRFRRHAAVLLAALAAGTQARADVAGPVARLDSGVVVGVPGRDPAILAYKGIPYAAAPTGERRWRAPQPVAAWQGVRAADRFGAACPQTSAPAGERMSEDCLFLNVWTGARSAQERRPVLVWFHGGGFFAGSGSAAATDGEQLARKGVILVTFNYRLGPLGFLATPALSRESGHSASGNYGLLDEIAALKWIRRNIAAFGGDPR